MLKISRKQGNPLSNTTSIIMSNPLPELCREGLCMIVLVSLIVLLRGFPGFHDFLHSASIPTSSLNDFPLVAHNMFCSLKPYNIKSTKIVIFRTQIHVGICAPTQSRVEFVEFQNDVVSVLCNNTHTCSIRKTLKLHVHV